MFQVISNTAMITHWHFSKSALGHNDEKTEEAVVKKVDSVSS